MDDDELDYSAFDELIDQKISKWISNSPPHPTHPLSHSSTHAISHTPSHLSPSSSSPSNSPSNSPSHSLSHSPSHSSSLSPTSSTSLSHYLSPSLPLQDFFLKSKDQLEELTHTRESPESLWCPKFIHQTVTIKGVDPEYTPAQFLSVDGVCKLATGCIFNYFNVFAVCFGFVQLKNSRIVGFAKKLLTGLQYFAFSPLYHENYCSQNSIQATDWGR